MRFSQPFTAAIAASLAFTSCAALASGAQAEQVTAAALEAQGVIVTAAMPCDEPSPGPQQEGGPQGLVCIVGDQMFIFSVSTNVADDHASSMPSDFDAAYREIESSRDTTMIDEGLDGERRSMAAERGPDPRFGLMRAIEVAPGSMAYAVSMSRPSRTDPLTDEYKQVMRDFVASLEIVE